jgi:cell division protein FtsA
MTTAAPRPAKLAGTTKINGGTPRRAPVRPRGSTIAAIDIGTTKVCCFIAQVDAEPRILGIGHQIAHGVRGGTIIDLEAAGESIRAAVHAAEQMAGETIARAVVNLSGGNAASRIVKTEIQLSRREVTDGDMRRALECGYRMRDAADRQVIHSIPIGFTIDDSRGILDPRGMVGDQLGINMHIVTAATASVRNHSAAIARSHLEAEALVVSPYAAGLACLVEDERDLGVTIIDMGGGTTSIGVFHSGNLIFADAVPVGGMHVTNDIARGLSTPLAHAERMKALFGSAISSTLDEREAIAVTPIGEEDRHVNHVPKSLLVSIIAPRLEETFELVHDRLEASGCDKIAGRVVLTGGACQLQGVRELAATILDRQIRIGRPMHINGLAEATHGPAFSTAAGLLLFALSEQAEAPPPAQIAPRGIVTRLMQWMRENL